MENFSYYNPTKLIFGKGQLEQLRKELKVYGKNVLLVYGGGSIKKNGLYDEVTRVLKEEGADTYELSGVEPNPRLATVKKGIELCARHDIDFLLAVGGGSVIDCTKAIEPEQNTTATLGISSAKKRRQKTRCRSVQF